MDGITRSAIVISSVILSVLSGVTGNVFPGWEDCYFLEVAQHAVGGADKYLYSATRERCILACLTTSEIYCKSADLTEGMCALQKRNRFDAGSSFMSIPPSTVIINYYEKVCTIDPTPFRSATFRVEPSTRVVPGSATPLDSTVVSSAYQCAVLCRGHRACAYFHVTSDTSTCELFDSEIPLVTSADPGSRFFTRQVAVVPTDP